MNRREFIQTSSLAVLGAATLSSFSLMDKRKIGMQLYSVRDIIDKQYAKREVSKKEVREVLTKLAGYGYKELEAYSYNDGMVFGLRYKEFADFVRSLGMRVTSSHHYLGKSPIKKLVKGSLLNEWEQAVADAKEAGQDFMVLAWLEVDERQSLDDYKFIVEQLHKAAEVCKKNSIQLSYHNHDFEFQSFEGQVAYDFLLKELDPKLVTMEMDMYWVNYAKRDPLEYFNKYPGRFDQWHVKDMDKNDPKLQVAVGTGRIDFKSIFAKAEKAGLKHFYLEQEHYPNGPLNSIEECINNFKKMI
jgi:sugar phosphate isomerase/epimerase